jgi:hypothetical protein
MSDKPIAMRYALFSGENFEDYYDKNERNCALSHTKKGRSTIDSIHT